MTPSLASSVALVLAAALSANRASAQLRAHFTPCASDYVGIAGLGDMNGDGHADIVVPCMSSVYALSGVDRSLLWSIPITAYSTASAGDVDGDTYKDVVVWTDGVAPGGSPSRCVRAYSGATQASLHEWFPPAQFAALDLRLSEAGDVDGDGHNDVMVAWLADLSMTPDCVLDVYSGASGGLLHRFAFPQFSGFGRALAAGGDVDADGFGDVIVGAIGHAYVLSGRTAGVLLDVVAPFANSDFGAAVAGLGDIDQDGHDDVAVSDPYLYAGVGIGAPRGAVHAFSGSTGARFWTSPSVWFDVNVGQLLVALNDFDSDGVRDLAVGGEWHGYGVNRIAFFSGLSGAPRGIGEHPAQALAIANLGDVNRDGLDDVGLQGYPAGGHGLLSFGVYLANAPAPQVYCTAKTNSAGCLSSLGYVGNGPSMSVGDELELWYGGLIQDVPAALVWSTTAASVPFAGGTLCVGPSVETLAIRITEGFGTQCGGSTSFTLRRSYLTNHGLGAGSTIYAQVITRDPGFAPPNNFGLTQALEIMLAP